MKSQQQNPIMVSKESISNLSFPGTEVLKSREEIKNRMLDLERATTLGNVEQTKIKIIFEDTESIKQVETTIWATTDKRIILKGGVVIPISRIHEVKIV
jgi:hypothetical protein